MTPEGMPKGESNKFVYEATLKSANHSRRISGTTARSIRGNSNASGTSNRRSPIPTCLCRRGRRGDFQNHRRRQNVAGISGLRGSDTGPKWQPGAGGMGLHTIMLDPKNPQRIYVAISAAGVFRTDDGGKTWKPINAG